MIDETITETLVDGSRVTTRVRAGYRHPISCVLTWACGHKETVEMASLLNAGKNQAAAKTLLCPKCREAAGRRVTDPIRREWEDAP